MKISFHVRNTMRAVGNALFCSYVGVLLWFFLFINYIGGEWPSAKRGVYGFHTLLLGAAAFLAFAAAIVITAGRYWILAVPLICCTFLIGIIAVRGKAKEMF